MGPVSLLQPQALIRCMGTNLANVQGPGEIKMIRVNPCPQGAHSLNWVGQKQLGYRELSLEESFSQVIFGMSLARCQPRRSTEFPELGDQQEREARQLAVSIMFHQKQGVIRFKILF